MPTEGSGEVALEIVAKLVGRAIIEAGVLPPARYSGCIEEVDVGQRPRFDDAEHLGPAYAVSHACDSAIEACADVDRRSAANDFQRLGSPVSQMDAEQFARHHGLARPLAFDTTAKPQWWWLIEFEAAYQRFMWYAGKNPEIVETARKRRASPVTFAGRIAASALDCVSIALADRYGAILKASTPDRYTIWLGQIKKPPFIGNTPSLERFRCAPMLSPGAVGIYSAAVFRNLRSLPTIAWESLRGEVAAELKVSGEQASPKRWAHSPDFRTVLWNGITYELTGAQAAVIKLLWEAHENGTPSIGGETLLDAAGTTQSKMANVFRDHPAWNSLVVDGKTKGSYRLAERIS